MGFYFNLLPSLSFLFQKFRSILQKFILGGRIILGPDANSLLLTISLIVIPIITFCACVGMDLLGELSSHRTTGTAILAVAVVFTFYVRMYVRQSFNSSIDISIVI